MPETIVASGEDADAELPGKLRLPEEGAPEVDRFEASRIMEHLSQAEVDEVTQTGDLYRVTLRVLGGVVSHFLKMQSAKDVFEYRRGFARVLDLPYTRQELTINLAAAPCTRNPTRRPEDSPVIVR